MDNRITRERLKGLLSYDLIKIIVTLVAGILVWSLLFTMLGDSYGEGQMLRIYSYDCLVATSEDKGINYLFGKGDEYLSYDIREKGYYNDFGYYGSNAYFGQQFQAWMSVGQIDLWFVSTVGDVVKTDETDENGDPITRSVVQSYSYCYADIAETAREALKYCEDNAGYSGGEFDEKKLKTSFLARKRRDNFYRHGLITLEDEKDRYTKIYDSATAILGWLADDTLDIWLTVTDESGQEFVCGIDMDKLNGLKADTESGLKASDLCKRNQEAEGVGGVGLAMFNNKRFQDNGHLYYEGLGFMVAVVRSYSEL